MNSKRNLFCPAFRRRGLIHFSASRKDPAGKQSLDSRNSSAFVVKQIPADKKIYLKNNQLQMNRKMFYVFSLKIYIEVYNVMYLRKILNLIFMMYISIMQYVV